MAESLTVKANELGDANDQRPAAAWWYYGHIANWSEAQKDTQVGQKGLPITYQAWSMPVWDGSNTSRRVRVWPNPALWDSPSLWESVPEWPALVPWDRFKAGVGTDNAVIVDDGEVSWEIQNLRRPSFFEWFPLGWRTRGAFNPTWDYVADLVHRVTSGCVEDEKHLAGALGKVRDREGLLTAEMAANGVTTALAMGTFNAQFGPPSMAFPPRFVKPATRIEHTTLDARPQWLPAGDDQRMIPRGTRFRLAMTDREIDEWALRHDGAKAITAVVIATGLRDYGWFDSLTVNAGPYLQCTGVLNPAERAVWDACGLRTERDFRGLLDGLFRLDNIKVVRAA